VSIGKSREYSGSNRHRQGLPQENSSSSTTKRKDGQMGLHDLKKLQHNQRNGFYIEETTHRMRENPYPYTSDKGMKKRIHKELKKTKPPKINDQ
jgi:hypothetical protein